MMVSKALAGSAAIALLVACSAAWGAAEPVFSDTGPDAAAYGANEKFPIGKRSALPPKSELVGRFSHFDEIYPSHRVAKGEGASPLRRASKELEQPYAFQGRTYSLRDYLERDPATGLLIARGDEILFEHYRYARTDRHRLLSQSMAKTITGLLVGIAVSEGAIRSIDQPAADYVPSLTGTEYGRTPIRALLHMSSGVAFRETYDGSDDSAARCSQRIVGGRKSPLRCSIRARFPQRRAFTMRARKPKSSVL